MGSVPSWWRVLVAAKYLQVPPWELADRPVFWPEIALAAQKAEADAERMRSKRKHSSSASLPGER